MKSKLQYLRKCLEQYSKGYIYPPPTLSFMKTKPNKIIDFINKTVCVQLVRSNSQQMENLNRLFLKPKMILLNSSMIFQLPTNHDAFGKFLQVRLTKTMTHLIDFYRCVFVLDGEPEILEILTNFQFPKHSESFTFRCAKEPEVL